MAPLADEKVSEEALTRKQACGAWLFRRRTWLPLLVLLPILFIRRGEWEHPGVTIPVAALLLVAGESVRIWAVGYAGSATRTRKSDPQRLVTAGPFAYVRNPLYLGNLLIANGVVVLYERPQLLPLIVLVFGFYYGAIVAWEEGVLRRCFGESYHHYFASVPRWLPRLRPYEAPSPDQFSLMRAIHSERGTFGTLACLVLFYPLSEILDEYGL